ncbi:MAG: hypothetical protein A2637_07510 [Candidatus Muproteobacteria bacterium RIFCSPHIGHO2_01_FULL_65_16]|uniref:Small-conductance mechanosensitive channel n=3 Tax=Candidatus Muproteobacteria TaxID=1817795 RepID=A0A1F6TGC1_9PROT|nr:MAG: hypothetical protein A2V92_06150 [Candidatus Muproteobacteria bacterium RBG_16_65_31]OGI47241.1 MAG: hypothetical protein A2637_07510 [Candidatus Muproteobacteria bacterium RIFCSPHIGHO2_01_FULL_65_16]OGI52229.1 MAG: hypothetical protein A3B81_06745 [Candidatus Muproteobacteria bacterium RIFCSPHIGHO2_02_FULL_65_16]
MEQVNVVVDAVRTFLVQLSAFLPKLLAAVVILIAGWMIAKMFNFIVIRGLKAISFNVITEAAGMDKFLRQGGIKKTTIDILGILIYWLVILGTLLVTFNTLGLGVVSELFRSIVQFVPNVIVAILILAIGLYFARFVDNVVVAYSRNIGVEDAELVGRMARYAIMVFVFVISLKQVQVGGDILDKTFLILIAGIVTALAISFGLGGQKWAATQLEKFMKDIGKKS